MENTVIEGQENVTGNDNQGARTFTQEEVNTIVSDRLKRERANYADYEDLKAKASKYDEEQQKNKSELELMTEENASLKKQLETMTKENEVKSVREKVAAATGVPANLLSAETEEACMEQAKGILAFAKPSGYPTVKDGGEVHKTQKPSAEQQFEEWFNETIGK